MATSANFRVLMPDRRWTPVRNEICDTFLKELTGKNSAFVFLILYDRAWHSTSKQVCATESEIQRWTLLDETTIADCIRELEVKGLIQRIRKGVPRNRVNKSCWKVPLADFRRDQESWTPVPRFLIRLYCPAFPRAVLLVLLLRFQHISWQNTCWPSVSTLSLRIGWSLIRTRRALEIMGDRTLWEEATTDLPWPLKITLSPDERKRFFRVRAVRYKEIRRNRRTEKIVMVSKRFRERFGLPDPEV